MKLKGFVFLLVISVFVSGVVLAATKINNDKISSNKSVKIVSNHLNFSLSPDEKYVAVVKDKELIIYSNDLKTIIDKVVFPKENSGSNSISWAPDSRKLVLSEQMITSYGTDWNFYLIQLQQSDSKFSLIEKGYQNFIWYPDSSHFSVESKEGYTYFGDINLPEKLVLFWPNEKSPIRIVKWVSNENLIYCMGDKDRGLVYGISDNKGHFINEFPPNETFSLSNNRNILAYNFFTESESFLSFYILNNKKNEIKIKVDDNYAAKLGPWSPNDDKIGYIVNSTKTLWVYDLLNGSCNKVISLNKGIESVFNFSWWIDNANLAFIYSETPYFTSTQTKIGIYNLEKKKYKTTTINDNIYNIINTKDGSGLYFMSSENNELCYINLKEI